MKTPEFENVLISEKRKRGNFKTIHFQKTKTIQFRRRNENTLVSPYIQKREKGKRSNFTFKSSTSRRRPFYFYPGPSDVEALPPHYNYTTKVRRRKANIDESADELKNIFRPTSTSPSLIYIDNKYLLLLSLYIKLQSVLYIGKTQPTAGRKPSARSGCCQFGLRCSAAVPLASS